MTEIIDTKLKITENKCSHLHDVQEELLTCTNVLDERLTKISEAALDFNVEKETAEKLKELKKRAVAVNKRMTASLAKLKAYEAQHIPKPE